MARQRRHPEGVEALDELEGLAERAAHWVAQNPRLLIGVTAAILAGFAAYAAIDAWSSRRQDRASTALAQVQRDYLLAMGAEPGSLEVPELANPEAAAQVRAEYAESFRAVAEQHEGTVPAVLAWLEVGRLRTESGDAEGGLAAWETGLGQAPAASALRGTLLEKIAHAHERAGRWQEAAAAHLAAAGIEAFPLRHWALAEAARCLDAAGDTARARELLERVEAEAPSLQLPDHLQVRLRELRALQSG